VAWSDRFLFKTARGPKNFPILVLDLCALFKKNWPPKTTFYQESWVFCRICSYNYSVWKNLWPINECKLVLEKYIYCGMMMFSTTRGQFQKHFMCSFYAPRSHECKKNIVKPLVFFALLGICERKSCTLNVGDIDPIWFDFLTVQVSRRSCRGTSWSGSSCWGWGRARACRTRCPSSRSASSRQCTSWTRCAACRTTGNRIWKLKFGKKIAGRH